MSTAGRKPNRLIHEASPYLQQHAYNPVDWYPWGKEALARARAEDKPILLSIGYSACHWCHVMERESFEDEDIARLMNEHFVNIKVDREERPDLDHLYQTVCQLVTRQGGWPLTVFLTPDLRPFYVGTYFPPEDRYGRPGFPRILRAVARAYREQRDQVEQVAREWTEALRTMHAPPAPDGRAPDAPWAALVEKGAREIAAQVDRRHGGFGGAPKFPQTPNLELLLRMSQRPGGEGYLDLVTLTLRKMAEGGIYDQLGGGFHRYSVDARWAVPHFEKMLYDNALLVPVYLAAWQLTADPLHARVVRETLAYVAREMTHPGGGFYSTQDADSEGEEGRYYVWTPEEIQAVLGEDDGELLCRHLGVTPGGNFEHGRTVLHVAKGAGALAAEVGLSPEEVTGRLESGKARLLAARERRVPPHRDEKVLTGWNGLMIRALAQAARTLGDPSYAGAARRAADFVLGTLTAPDGSLLRRYRDGHGADIPGTLEDHAFLAEGLLELYQATFAHEYLEAAVRLAHAMLDRFWEPGAGFFLTGPGAGDLIDRPREFTDGATPSPASVATRVLLRLYPYTGDERFRQVAEQNLRLHRVAMERIPAGMASLLAALDLFLSGAVEVTVVAPPGDPTAAEWLRRIGQLYLPDLVLERMAPGEPDDRPLRQGKSAKGGRATLYVCRNFTCSPPATAWAEAERWLLARP
ncbi:thioredoxin domain-containing protein [Caldinitratiruptor microaerophilus]|uniref:Thioredoxin domain-containing protein n=1 Tax=Caldinitratiruptor microaerophilus TaxID=671077 RepID=A0AA35CL95_9FIRM|nr:thioredoxin domain-containing protein [Caldinitratiruptor microaerophilus]BDG61395.1 thioredoxin domain-containing protein [Caldinitratiruptor microaerophilus]